MAEVPTSSIARFAALPDPRMDRTRQHRLVGILAIALYAVLCGADDVAGMAA